MPKTAAHLKKHQFKKGESGNPKGSVPNPALRALRRLTQETYREVIELVLTGNLTDLKKMAENPETPAIQVGVAAAFMKAIKNGDYAVIERIAERIVGKIPDVINVNSNNNTSLALGVIDREKLKTAFAKLESDV